MAYGKENEISTYSYGPMYGGLGLGLWRLRLGLWRGLTTTRYFRPDVLTVSSFPRPATPW